MNVMRITLGLALSALLVACSDPQAPQQDAAVAATGADDMNPFFVESDLPYGMPHFDRIRDGHYMPAFQRGMAEHMAEIEAIANNPEAPTFENTIVAMERAGLMLNRVAAVFFNMTGAHTNDALNQIQGEVSPLLAAHADAINLNPTLFARVETLYQARDTLGLDAESLRLLERYRRNFIRAGAQLDETQKARMREINGELARLGAEYSNNSLAEVNADAVVVDSRDELAGLSDAQIQSYADEAESRGMPGHYVITLRNTTQQPVLASLSNRALRERIQRISEARGSHGGDYDNRQLVVDVLRLRDERAHLLGYPDHASYVLEVETAANPQAVNDMLGRLAPRAAANARREAADLQAVVDAQGGDFQVASWDWLYYTEILRQQRFNFDESQLRPYFELNNVLQNGVFFFAEKLYGLTFVEHPELPVYQEDVRAFEVFLDGQPIGLFLFDPYARSSKRGGAWMNEYVSQSGLMGSHAVVGNHLNIVKPPAGEPTLLTFDEVTTMFHEFGHAVHGLVSDSRYPTFAGTNVPRDFVEFPSQVHEMWATWPEVLANYAVHYQTGEPIPQDLLQRVMDSQLFNEGFATTEYLAAAIIDQRWHQTAADHLPDADHLMQTEADFLAAAGIAVDQVPPRYRTPYFSHIMGGYDAGYYAYIWSEVLDANTVQWFKENGGMTRANGDHFRETLLSRGGSRDAMELFRDFAGRDPRIEPLLERRGLN